MPLTIICPDKNEAAFKRLVSDIGLDAAYLSWFRNGNKTPFTAEAEKLLGSPVIRSSDWRRSFDETSDIEQKIDWLRAVANKKSTAPELADVLSRTEKLLGQQKHSRLANTLWDVAHNPAASPETKSRALALYEDFYKPESQSSTVAKPTAPKSPLEILNTSKAVKLKVPDGTTMIRGTDSKGRKSVQPIGFFKTGNPFQGADIVKIEAGRIGLQKQFIPLDEPVGVEERKVEKMVGESGGSDERYNDVLQTGDANRVYDAIIERSPDEFHRELAKQLKAAGVNPTVRLANRSEVAAILEQPIEQREEGGHIGNTIFIYDNIPDQASTFLHEAVHHATEEAENDPKFGAEIDALLTEARHAADAQLIAGGAQDGLEPNMTTGGKWYGLSNGREFIAEGFSNPEFQDFLRGAKAPASLWQRFLNLIRRILKLPEKFESLLDRLMKATKGRFSEPSKAGQTFEKAVGEPKETTGAESPEGEIHQIGGRKYHVSYPELLTPEDYALGRQRLVNLVQQDLFLPGIEDDHNIYTIQPDGQNHDADGKKLVAALTNAIENQNLKGTESAAMAPLLVRMVNYNLDAWGEIFSKPIADELRAISAGSSSQTAQRLAMMKGGAIPKDVVDVVRKLNFNLRATYSNLTGGGTWDDETMKRLLKEFGAQLDDETLKTIAKEHPEADDQIRVIMDIKQAQGGNRLFKAIQRRMTANGLDPKQMEKNARFQEEVAALIQVLTEAGIQEPPPRKGMTALEKLRLMVTDKTQEKINTDVEAAITAGEIEAGKTHALNQLKSEEERTNLMKRYEAGELPSQTDIDAGLQLANFSKWKVARDVWAHYDPVTVKLARQVAGEDFKGMKFGTPKAKPEDSRISIQAVAKQPDAEVARVFEAALNNVEANLPMEGVTAETKLAVRQVIKEELLSQLEKSRAAGRDAMFAEAKKKGVALTPEQKAAQLVNAKLFSDNRIEQMAELERIARKSPLTRLVPTVTQIARAVLDTPTIFQGDMAKNFVNEFVKKFTADFQVDESQVPGLRKAVTEAYTAKLKEAAKKAYEQAEAKMTPKEKLAMPKTDKKFWKVFEQLKNAGVLDSDEALKRFAAAKGLNIPTPEEVAAIKRTVARIQELENPTPARRDRIVNDPGLTPEEKSKQIRQEQQLAEAKNMGEIRQLQEKLGNQWAKFTKPLNLTTPMGRRNTTAAIYQYAVANILAKFRFPVTLFQHVQFQHLWSYPTRLPAVIYTIVKEHQAHNLPLDVWETSHNAIQTALKQQIESLGPAIRALRAQMAGRGENRNVDGLLRSVNSLGRAQMASKEYWAKGDKVRAVLTATIAMWRIPLRVVGGLDALMREQVEYQEIRNQFAVEMAKQGKTNAETEMAWEKAWGQITERMTAAYMEARDAFEAYDTLKTPLPENAIFQGLREMWDKGSRENAIKEAADRLIKVHAYQLMESLGLPVDSMRARNLRRAVGMTWQSQPAAGTVGNVMYAGASEWNRLVLGKNLPMFPAYFARAIANGVNYYGRFLPIPGTWFTGNIDPEGKGTDWSNETETDRRENFNRKWIIGPVFGGLVALWIYTHKAKVNSHYPTDKKEREKFITEGHKVNTIEFLNDDGSFIPFSLNIGPFAPLAVYAVAAQAVMDQNDKYAKEQAKADAVAKAHGLQPSPIPHDWAMDDLEVAGKAGYQALLGSATAVGLTSGFNEFGIPNAKKAIASVLSPLVPGLPNYQSVSRMMGVALDSHIATVFDFMVPLPTSGARMLNALGDPVKTPNDIQRIVQELTGGSYPFPVDPKSVADGQQAYANMLSTGYQPPPVSPARGFNINGEYRPMNTAELEAYTAKRGELFKANLAALGANPSKDQVKSAFQEANQQALSSVGAAPAAPQRVSGVSGQRRGAVGGRAQAQRMGRATVGGRGTIRGSLKMSGRRVNLRGTRASMRSTGKIHAAKMPRLSSGSSLRMKRRVRL